ncbi:MAG TPA: ATP-binding protein, partial [Actinomycetota bacterium]|nr:ATP-binding protein [Actinomycetota bacterium]
MRPAVPPDQARRRPAPGPEAVRTTPYQGLLPFAEQDAAFFFGRDTERTILVANLMAARLTLVYGESGVGKSSILRAGVVHHLREQERAAGETPRLLVVYFNEWSGDPVARLLDRIAQEIARALGQAAPAVEVSPARLAASLEAWTTGWNLDLLVILDQFEEYFLYHPDEEGPGTFATEFPQAVNRSDLPVSFLVAIREDALAKLDRFKGSVANLFENYVRVRHLRASQAEAAVLGPLTRLSERSPGEEPWTADPELVGGVLDGVQVGKVVLAAVGRGVAAEAADREAQDPPIETPYLQMVLTRLWAEEAAKGSRRLRLATLEALGGPERIVRTHLDEALDRLPAGQREVAARVFHYLVTATGSKVAHTATDLAAYTGLPLEQVRSVLDRLSAPDARILRAVAAPSGQDGEPRHEIFHDVLAPAILGWRARWVAARQAEAAAERQLEVRTRRWRRRRALAALLVGVVVVALAGLVVRTELVARDKTTTATILAGRARRSATTAYVARADTVCVKGWAKGREAAPAPRPDGRLPLANWLWGRVRIGKQTSGHWRSLETPPGTSAKLEVLEQYDRGLKAYDEAATLLAAGETEAANRKLREGDRIGVRY